MRRRHRIPTWSLQPTTQRLERVWPTTRHPVVLLRRCIAQGRMEARQTLESGHRRCGADWCLRSRALGRSASRQEMAGRCHREMGSRRANRVVASLADETIRGVCALGCSARGSPSLPWRIKCRCSVVFLFSPCIVCSSSNKKQAFCRSSFLNDTQMQTPHEA